MGGDLQPTAEASFTLIGIVPACEQMNVSYTHVGYVHFQRWHGLRRTFMSRAGLDPRVGANVGAQSRAACSHTEWTAISIHSHSHHKACSDVSSPMKMAR